VPVANRRIVDRRVSTAAAAAAAAGGVTDGSRRQ